VTLAAAVLLASAGPARAGVWGEAGVVRALTGDGADAVDLLARVPQPTRAERYFRAVALDRAGFRPAAFGLWAELSVSDGAFSGPALEELVKREFGRARYDRVIASYEAARPGRLTDPAGLWYRVGQSYRMLGRQQEAAEALARVDGGTFLPYALHTLAQIRFEQDRHAEALDLLAEAIEAAPPPLADRIRLTRGRVLYQVATGLSDLTPQARRRALATARAQFDRVGPDSPWYPEALEGMGWCDLELGAAAAALAAFGLAAERDPGREPLYLWAEGRAYEAAGVPAEAARWYGRARDRARAAAAALEARADRPEVAAVWRRELDRIRPVARRLDTLDARLEAVSAALVAREGALARRAGRVDRAEAGLAALGAELGRMSEGVGAYLDTVPLDVLVPRQTRPRVSALSARHRGLDREADRLYGAAEALEAASPGAAQGLRDRLLAVRQRLARARAAFLEGLRQRVSARQKELAARIAQEREGLATVASSVEGVREALEEAAARVGRARQALRGLRGRIEVVRGKIEALRAEAQAQGRRATRERLVAEASRWRRRADLYALDETQALHLLREGRP